MLRSRGSPLPAFVATLLVCWLAVAALAAGAAAAGPAGDRGIGTPPASQSGAAPATVATQDFQADRTEFRVTVYENGSARWVFRHEQGLESEEDRQNFQEFAEEFNTNETDLYTNFQTRAVALTDNGSESTGREMSAEDFRRDARTEGFDDSLGVVEMSFRWEGFAATGDGRVVVGDIFQGGLYLTEDQRFVVRAGPGLAFESVDPSEDAEFSGDSPAESSTVTWQGERSFLDNRPRIVLVSEENVSTPTEDPGGTGPGWILPLGALVVVLLLGLGAAFAYRAGVFPSEEGGAAAGVDDRGDGGGGGDAAAADGARAEAGAAAGAATGVPEEELISDEERVVQLLEDHGGRMKQVNIVDETGWSKSKVSMLLSDMEEEGTISKLRVGRENIVSMAGQEPEAAGSPFDEEN